MVWNFRNSHPSEGLGSFLTGTYTGNFLWQQDSQSSALHFIDILAQISTELWRTLISWPRYLTVDLKKLQTDVWHNTTRVDLVWWLLVKNATCIAENVIISFKEENRRPT